MHNTAKFDSYATRSGSDSCITWPGLTVVPRDEGLTVVSHSQSLTVMSHGQGLTLASHGEGLKVAPHGRDDDCDVMHFQKSVVIEQFPL